MKQRGKKSLKIIDAIVRGGKIAYEFEVFPIETEFEPQSAVYIFSQRKTDKTGRGHQKFFCIGQTISLDGEFSKFKKQFASKYKANVICVRIEEEEKLRSEIERELKAAYSISCSNNIEKISAKAEKRPLAKQVSNKQISEKNKSVEPQKHAPIIKLEKNRTTKTPAGKFGKSLAGMNSAKDEKLAAPSKNSAVKKVKQPDSPKTVPVGKKKIAESKVSGKNRKPPAKIKPAKAAASSAKAKKPLQKIKQAPIEAKKVSTVKAKNNAKKQKLVSAKPENKKATKLTREPKVSGKPKEKNDSSIKAISKNKPKSVAAKVTGKNKNRPSKSAARKQLAF